MASVACYTLRSTLQCAHVSTYETRSNYFYVEVMLRIHRYMEQDLPGSPRCEEEDQNQGDILSTVSMMYGILKKNTIPKKCLCYGIKFYKSIWLPF